MNSKLKNFVRKISIIVIIHNVTNSTVKIFRMSWVKVGSLYGNLVNAENGKYGDKEQTSTRYQSKGILLYIWI